MFFCILAHRSRVPSVVRIRENRKSSTDMEKYGEEYGELLRSVTAY